MKAQKAFSSLIAVISLAFTVTATLLLILPGGCSSKDPIPVKLPTVDTFEPFNSSQHPLHWEISSVVLSDGGSPILSCGVTWSEITTPTAADKKTVDGAGIGSFLSPASPDVPSYGILLNHMYYVRGYATNKAGTAYGPAIVKSLFILIVNTADITNILSTGAKSGGTIVSDGGAPITSRGVCWRVDFAGTIDDPNTHFTTDGTGGGSFTSSMTGLLPNTMYYVRSYAVNATATGYGNILTFTTPP